MNVPPPERDDPASVENAGSAEHLARQRQEAERRRLAADIAAALLPGTTSDERDPSGSTGSGRDERWYTENRPPHHG